MRVTRKGVFETNSSSTHTIAVAPGDIKELDTIPIDDGVCRIYPGEFGWGPERYFDAPSKASYCLTYAKGKPDEGELLELLSSVIRGETGAAIEFVPSTGEFYEWGYIDHQSDRDESDVCGPIFADGAETLRRFIFNPKSILVIDNDNH